MTDAFKCTNCDKCLEDPMQICQRSPHLGPAQRPQPSAGLAGSIALLKNGEIERDDLIKACRDAGFKDRHWKALTFDRQPYDVTYPTVELQNLVKILTGCKVVN